MAPLTCPYTKYCAACEELTSEEQENFCGDFEYLRCPQYATEYRADALNCFTRGISAAFLRHLRDGGLEILAVAPHKETGEDVGELVIKGFNNGKD